MTRVAVHLALHVFVPFVVARFAFKAQWMHAWMIMMAALVVDLDHLLADPIFDPYRCGIGYHPLHSYPAIAAYAGMVAIRPLRIVATGLLIHMALDGSDCLWQWWQVV